MVREKFLRQERGWSGMETARGRAFRTPNFPALEHRRFIPYPSQLAKLANALGWTGDRAALLEEVDDGPKAS